MNQKPIDESSVMLYGKVPPQAIELEESVLAAIMLEGNAIRKIDFIKPEVFYKDDHRKIFSNALQLHEKGIPVDILTLSDQLRKNNQLDEIGGPSYLAKLRTSTGTVSMIDYHSRILYQKFIQRELIRISTEIQTRAFDDSIDISDLIDFSRESLNFKIEFTKKLQTLEECRLRIDDELMIPPALLEILEGTKSIPICKRGNITTLKGKGKAGKTTTSIMIISSLLNQGKLFNKFYCPFENLNIALFDTEESKYDALTMIRIACRLRGIKDHPKNLNAFSLKTFSPKQRLRYIREYLYNNDVDFVLLDGVRDLVRNKNSEDEATDISTEIMQWNEERNCHIVTLIHENKGDFNATGHLGTEMNNKSESVISSSRECDDSNVFTITDDYPRGRGKFSSINWRYDNDMPVLIDYERLQKRSINNHDDESPF